MPGRPTEPSITSYPTQEVRPSFTSFLKIDNTNSPNVLVLRGDGGEDVLLVVYYDETKSDFFYLLYHVLPFSQIKFISGNVNVDR